MLSIFPTAVWPEIKCSLLVETSCLLISPFYLAGWQLRSACALGSFPCPARLALLIDRIEMPLSRSIAESIRRHSGICMQCMISSTYAGRSAGQMEAHQPSRTFSDQDRPPTGGGASLCKLSNLPIIVPWPVVPPLRHRAEPQMRGLGFRLSAMASFFPFALWRRICRRGCFGS